MKRRYYSVRTGQNPQSAEINLETLKALFTSIYLQWDQAGYFQEYFGYDCVDAGHVPGKLGSDIAGEILFSVRKKDLWPFLTYVGLYQESDLFDIIEFLHDHISKPITGYNHSYNNCGYHFRTFDAEAGKREYRDRVNQVLESYKSGFEISASGEVLGIAQPGMAPLLTADAPTDDENIASRVAAAISKFRRYRSTLAERRDAIRDLADVLEYLRPRIKEVLTKADEKDLFEIANNFGIRHHNQRQKIEYDAGIWLSWMFYYYLATIHACLHMLKKRGR